MNHPENHPYDSLWTMRLVSHCRGNEFRWILSSASSCWAKTPWRIWPWSRSDCALAARGRRMVVNDGDCWWVNISWRMMVDQCLRMVRICSMGMNDWMCSWRLGLLFVFLIVLWFWVCCLDRIPVGIFRHIADFCQFQLPIFSQRGVRWNNSTRRSECSEMVDND